MKYYCDFRFETTGNAVLASQQDRWRCINCNRIVERRTPKIYPKKPPSFECPAAPEIIIAATQAAGKLGLLDAAGNLASDAIHYSQSLARWAWAGFPVRSAEETAICYKICSGDGHRREALVGGHPCDKFTAGKCAICGCPVKKIRGMRIKNKAVLKTEQCPHEDGLKWPVD